MRRIPVAVTIFVVAIISVTGCADSTDAITSISPSHSLTGTDLEAEILAEAGITVLAPENGGQSATGGVRIGVDRALLAFSAIVSANGATTRGQYEYREQTPTGELRLHGDVVCLHVKGGNNGTFGGPITHAQLPAGFGPLPDNALASFNVIDGGEGPGSIDLASRAGIGSGLDFCLAGAQTELVVAGNLQVRQ